jgi:hypothetical protein
MHRVWVGGLGEHLTQLVRSNQLQRRDWNNAHDTQPVLAKIGTNPPLCCSTFTERKGINEMSGDAPISWLMFFTLSAGVAIGAAFFVSFLRSRHNREIAAYALEGDGRSQRGEPSGAGVELVGLFALAIIAMTLLTVGYNARSDWKPAPQKAGPNNELSTPRTDPNAPKPYQPNNPGPDTRSPVTGSSTGTGADSGGRPEQQPKP